MLPDIPQREVTADSAEKGQVHEDNLDRHVEDVLSKRDKYRRIMQGVWAFMKTRECIPTLTLGLSNARVSQPWGYV